VNGITAIRALIVLLGLAAWYGTQYLIGAKRPLPADEAAKAGSLLTEGDLLLHLTARINRYLNQQHRVANVLLIGSSTIIDFLGVFVIGWSIVGPSLGPFLGLIILFGLRQICQALTALPPPAGMIWRHPGWPSLFVTYGVANDLFFSGHTALAVYGAVQVALLGSGWLVALAVLIALFEIAAVLVLRAHYTIDVFGGMMTALLAAWIAAYAGPCCDAALARLLSSP
jgi:PAP2 superfamily C-terminal